MSAYRKSIGQFLIVLTIVRLKYFLRKFNKRNLMHIIQSIKLIFCAQLNNIEGIYTRDKIDQKIGEALHTLITGNIIVKNLCEKSVLTIIFTTCLKSEI